MLLKEGECVLCDTQEECVELASMLHEDGYYMLAGFGPCYPFALKSDTAGFRWAIGEKFPCCIARITPDQADTLLDSGTLSDASGVNMHTWYTFSEWSMKDGVSLPSVDDLI